MAKNLTKINLSYNDLTGGISSTNWIDLSNLLNLDLRSNSINGSIPVILFSLPSQQKLHNFPTIDFLVYSMNFTKVNFNIMDTLDLSSNKLEGPYTRDCL